MLYKLRSLVKADKVLMNGQHSEIRILWTRNVVRFEVYTAVTRNNAAFWDVVPCRSHVNRCFGGTYRLHLQGRKIRERGLSVSRLPQTLNMEAIRSSETTVQTRSTLRQIPEDGILHRNVIVSIFYLTKAIEMVSAS
jgi:hypothetical protein